VLVGDSITQWFQTDGKVHYNKHFLHLKPINIGVAGDTTDQTITRLNDGSLGSVTSSKVTTLMIGTNDIGWGYSESKISAQIGKVIEILQSKLKGTSILLLGILPRRSLPEMPGKVNRLLAEYDNGRDVRFLDMTNQFTNNGKILSTLYKTDQLHLSPEGYRVFAETMKPVIIEILKGKMEQ